MQVHDSLGGCLLTIRRMLEGNKNLIIMKNTVGNLKTISIYIVRDYAG